MSEAKPFNIDLSSRLAREIDYGVHATFANMFGLKPKAQQHQVLKDWSVQGDVSGIITLTQENRNEGTMVVCFPKATIFAVLQKMYRKPFGEINQTVKMGVGELTNIIFGVVKANLNKDGFTLKMAVPSVIIGEQHTVQICDSGAAMIVPFESDAGSFSVIVSFHDEQTAQKAA